MNNLCTIHTSNLHVRSDRKVEYKSHRLSMWTVGCILLRYSNLHNTQYKAERWRLTNSTALIQKVVQILTQLSKQIKQSPGLSQTFPQPLDCGVYLMWRQNWELPSYPTLVMPDEPASWANSIGPTLVLDCEHFQHNFQCQGIGFAVKRQLWTDQVIEKLQSAM